MIGKTVSHYKILEKLSEGGMGVIYLAEDININRKAVLKFLPTEMENDPDINLRFKREAQAAGSLSHPNIVTIYDVGVYDNKTFIAMEYVEGKTLRELIKSDGELTIERITDISIQICEGLNESHSKGITHRDIKPENILIDEKGKVKIVDFGLAKITNVSKELTKQSSTLGTIKYMSPEQIRNQKVDQRTDIWSFGVILYEMITGKYPFKGEHDASLFYSIINQSPEPLARYKADINEGYQRIIDKALDKEPDTRYQHIDELLSDLRREKRDSGEFAVSNLKRRNTRLIKRISLIFASLIVIALIFIAANYFLNSPTKKIEPPRHTQLTFEGNIYFFDDIIIFDRTQISPNGQFTAYVVNKGNENSIYIRDNFGAQAIEIYKGLGWVSSLRWSPNGNEIFFSAGDNYSSRSSYIIPKLGGKTQELKYIGYGSWSPNGKLIAGIRPSSKQIRLIKRESDDVEKTIKLTGDFTWMDDIDWSPIGDRILFLTKNDTTGKHQLWTINTDGSQQLKILDEDKAIYSPRWSPDGNHIYYLYTNETTQDLMKIEISSINSDKESQVIQTGLQAYGFSITRDNKKLCYSKYNVFANLWVYYYNEKRNLLKSKKLTEGTSYYSMPALSPDGTEIALVHKDNIFKMTVNGDSIKQLTFLSSICYSPTWSPDGKEIAFISGSNLAKIFTDGGTPTIFENTTVSSQAFWESVFEIFCQKPGSRNFYIYNPVTRKNKLLITNDSVGWMFSPRLSPDKSNIALFWNLYPRVEDIGLWKISKKDSSSKLLLRGNIIPLNWSKDGKWIYAIDYNITPTKILMISAITGVTKLLYTLPPGKIYWGGDIDITPDGKTIVCAVQETNSDVWMIENFDPDVE